MSNPSSSILVAGLLLGACATTQSGSSDDRVLAVDCDEMVVIGRLKNGEYEHVEIEDDLLGHGWISAELRVRSVEKGRAVRLRLPVRYFAHTYMREDRDFMFVLSLEPGGGYLVSTAQLMSYRPRWVNRCGRTGSAAGS